MASEFTGERVIPGQVDPDLWNEHFARYAFAGRLARMKRVLDLGCGSGYGSAELAQSALTVAGVDISGDAITFAKENFGRLNLEFQTASCTELPFADASFDLVVSFEVIEHLDNWPRMIAEARRVLSPHGQFVVSTPNKSYYAESRKQSGPNPFHVHEFELDEFQAALAEYFPHVSLFTENHTDGIAIRPVRIEPITSAELRMEPSKGEPESAHFYLAVCALSPQTGSPSFVYLPASGNVLRERELHIARLEEELATKNEWLERAKNEHHELVEVHERQTQELKASNEWAKQIDTQLKSSGVRVTELQQELDAQQRTALETVAGYEAALRKVEEDLVEKVEWAVNLEKELLTNFAAKDAELTGMQQELVKVLDLLHATEKTVEERTRWAQSLDVEIEELRQQVAELVGSRWFRIGRKIGMGPGVARK
jgi:ubiquinone/menaquinone biosynthesis C-methylase UbiE